jgi:hypothetical protein
MLMRYMQHKKRRLLAPLLILSSLQQSGGVTVAPGFKKA